MGSRGSVDQVDSNSDVDNPSQESISHDSTADESSTRGKLPISIVCDPQAQQSSGAPHGTSYQLVNGSLVVTPSAGFSGPAVTINVLENDGVSKSAFPKEKVTEKEEDSALKEQERRKQEEQIHRAMSLAYLQESLAHDSLSLISNNRSWIKVYHYLSQGESLSPSFRTIMRYLLMLSLPNDLENAMLCDLLANGEDSISATHLRDALVEMYTTMLQEEITALALQDPNKSALSSTLPASKAVENGFREHLNSIVKGLSQGGVIPNNRLNRDLDYWRFPLRQSRDQRKLKGVLQKSGGNITPPTWEQIAASTIRGISGEAMEIPMGARVILSRNSGEDTPNLLNYAMANQRWAQELHTLSLEERESLENILRQLRDVRGDSSESDSSLSLNSLLRSIYEAQELVTPRRLLEFATLVEECNMEWAIASFEWIREGEESQVLSTLRRVLRDSPWSDTPSER